MNEPEIGLLAWVEDEHKRLLPLPLLLPLLRQWRTVSCPGPDGNMALESWELYLKEPGSLWLRRYRRRGGLGLEMPVDVAWDSYTAPDGRRAYRLWAGICRPGARAQAHRLLHQDPMAADFGLLAFVPVKLDEEVTQRLKDAGGLGAQWDWPMDLALSLAAEAVRHTCFSRRAVERGVRTGRLALAAMALEPQVVSWYEDLRRELAGDDAALTRLTSAYWGLSMAIDDLTHAAPGQALFGVALGLRTLLAKELEARYCDYRKGLRGPW